MQDELFFYTEFELICLVKGAQEDMRSKGRMPVPDAGTAGGSGLQVSHAPDHVTSWSCSQPIIL